MLVPTDLPARIAARGIPVKVIDGWERRGGVADHAAIVIHDTASSAGESPSSCVNYCFLRANDAPLYNVIIDRTGVAWVGARQKSNNAGRISSVALSEVQGGRANLTPASKRGLTDDTSSNKTLFAVSVQNDGVNEQWSPAATNAVAVVCDVVLSALGLPHAGYVTTHKALTRRKIDTSNEAKGCPQDWHSLINNAQGGPASAQGGRVGIARTPSGKGYWICAPDGGVFSFGDAQFYGSMGDKKLVAPIVDIGAMPDGKGYALAASDGGIFCFGSCGFEGSMGGEKLAAPVTGIEIDADGKGYWLVASDGGVFSFEAEFAGSAAGHIRPWTP